MNAQAPLVKQSRAAWLLEQFRLIHRMGMFAAGSGLVIYGVAYFALRYWQTLVICALLVILLAGFFLSWQITRRNKPERGIEAFAFSIIGFMVSSFYFQSDIIGFNVMVLFVPIVLANYLLPPRRTRRVVVASSLAILHNLLIATLNPFQPPSFPLPANIALNLVVGPSVLAI
ncbi:MAG: hypothetical protein AAB658_04130, partial [Chloroflexota bacterium]